MQNDNSLILQIFISVSIVQSAGFSCCGLYSAVVAGPSGGRGVQTVQFWQWRLVPAWLCGAGRAARVAAVAAPAGPQSRCTAGVTCNLPAQHPPPDTANHINPVQHRALPTCGCCHLVLTINTIPCLVRVARLLTGPPVNARKQKLFVEPKL